MASAVRLQPFAARLLAASVILVVAVALPTALGDSVVLKNGTTLRGYLDKDNTLAFVIDNLKRTIFYNSKIDHVVADAGFSKLERFQLIQPLDKHVGIQPSVAVNIEATPWDEKGRRDFRYMNNNQRVVQMKQAIHEIGPFLCRFRGIDGFWQGQVATSQIPRPVILGLLGKVDQTNQDERMKVTRWLIQAGWYPEALAAIDGILRDFPACDLRLTKTLQEGSTAPAEGVSRVIVSSSDNVLLIRIIDPNGKILVDTDETRLKDKSKQIESLRELIKSLIVAGDLTKIDKDRVLAAVKSIVGPGSYPSDPGLVERMADTRRAVLEIQGRDNLADLVVRRKAQQPLEVLNRLRAIPSEGLPRDVLDEIRDEIRKDEDQAVSDRLLADSIRDLAEKLPEADRKPWKVALAEVLEVLSKAPDAARPRLEAMAKADSKAPPETRFALAMSGWVVGPEAAIDNLKAAAELWHVRSIVHDYLASKSDSARATLLADLQKIEGLEIDTVARIVVRMDPPLRDPDPKQEKPGVITLHRVLEDDNPVPSEYALLLPPEYNPTRIYPTVVVLHDGRGPTAAVEWVAAEASRRGYIVIAPEYNIPGMGKAYHYSAGEHAAVELSLRDARKRYSIDSDRVYLAGQLEGGNMAWDFGLAHPDVFAGVVAISGVPAKYAWKYFQQIDNVPIYFALGEMAPLAREVYFDQYVKPQILKVQDITYVDYLKRGLEALPEEVPSFFDWMEKRKREPVPRIFDAATARPGDARFFGVIVREITQGRATSPEAAEIFGNNIRPATINVKTSGQGNLINVKTNGINRLDVWVSPKLIDFKKKFEIRWNDKPLFKGITRIEFDPMLDDLRNRGDRQQLYYFKAVIGMANPGPRTKGR
jgi:pimeloyl-ACP methyl ester carboxylesterase